MSYSAPIPGLRNILYLDLTEQSSKVVDRRELYKICLGGVGLATTLMLEEYKEGTGALDPEMPVILSTGP
ncbi:MAG: aldehyde ferredoxin oxidoreductase N-terminal domain-containing protein, partial [Methanosarcinaceae archaeon]|nr:aldehyde ferredoxin oxidoreductase N-terminal domain-containing protein [Methanosarcinaceae archaeon]